MLVINDTLKLKQSSNVLYHVKMNMNVISANANISSWNNYNINIPYDPQSRRYKLWV